MEMQPIMEMLAEMRADQETMQGKWTIGKPTEKETSNRSWPRTPERK
jgi:hypothetical protein